jgi:hypothetical protein
MSQEKSKFSVAIIELCQLTTESTGIGKIIESHLVKIHKGDLKTSCGSLC